MIRVKKLYKKFYTGDRELIAINDLNFEVPTGQFLAITGRSGAGKSTLLYQMSLLDHPTSGSVTIDGQEITVLPGPKRVIFRLDNCGFIFQDYALLPSLTAAENVILPMLMQGRSEDESGDKAYAALSHVGLEKLTDHLPSQLSGGEQQRVSIARAIVHGPRYLFADEPTANLDVESSEMILGIFLKLNKRQDLTIVMVTHEPEYARLADRNIELLDGKIIRDVSYKKKKLTR